MAPRGSPKHHVAVRLLETRSAKKLRFCPREVDPTTYAAAFAEQVSRGDDELREAARRAYRSHFGVELVEPVREWRAAYLRRRGNSLLQRVYLVTLSD